MKAVIAIFNIDYTNLSLAAKLKNYRLSLVAPTHFDRYITNNKGGLRFLYNGLFGFKEAKAFLINKCFKEVKHSTQ